MARDSLQNSTLASKSWQFPRDSKVLGVQPFFFFSFVCSFSVFLLLLFFFNKETWFFFVLLLKTWLILFHPRLEFTT